MSFLFKTSDSAVQRSNRYARKAEDLPISRKTAITRYLLFDYAQNEIAKYRSSLEDSIGEEKLALLERRELALKRKKEAEIRRIEDYYGEDFGDLMPNKIRKLMRIIVAGGLTGAIGIVGLGSYAAYNWITTSQALKNGREVLIPHIEEALKGENILEATKNYNALVDGRRDLLEERLINYWDQVDSVGRSLDNFKRLLNAREKLLEAQKLTDQNNYVEALRLLEGSGGINALMGGVARNELPSYKQKEFDDLTVSISKLIEKCSQYKSDSNKFNPIKEDIPKFIEKIKSLDELLDKGSLFETESVSGIVKIVERYLGDLDEVDQNAIGGSAALQEIKEKLINIRDSVVGQNGLLTKYEMVEYNKVKNELETVKTSLNELANTQYVEEGVESDVSKVKKLLESAKSDLRRVDTARVDIFDLVRDVSALEGFVIKANEQAGYIAKLRACLKNSDENEMIAAAVELTKRYFERDYGTKKWDRVRSFLNLIPEMKRESVEAIDGIISLEQKLSGPEGQIFVRDNGLTNQDLVGYRISMDILNDKNDENLARKSVNDLLKKADLPEGREAMNLLDNLVKLHNTAKIFESPASKPEEEANRKLALAGAVKRIEDERVNLKVALAKFENAAKTYLENGDRVPSPELLTTLSRHYSELGKKKEADEYSKKAAELKNKYKLE